ncbi:hypothetical protein GJ496_002887 [Pomphorhynchus laevis]|nr:hypothetical protein GJ496_002887 [Pomphorhynchus laevis]
MSIDDCPIKPLEPSQLDLTIVEDAVADVERRECPCCKRYFAVERFAKHFKMCERQCFSTREIFESYKQRVVRLGNKYIHVDAVRPEICGKDHVNSSNWRKHHANFVKQIRETRKTFALVKAGKPLPPVVPGEIPDHYLKCPNCCRHFDPKAAERHFPFCEDKFKKLRSSMFNSRHLNATNSAMLVREERRKKYKAPLVKKTTISPGHLQDLDKSFHLKLNIKDVNKNTCSVTCDEGKGPSMLPSSSTVKETVISSQIDNSHKPQSGSISNNSAGNNFPRKICRRCSAKVEQPHACYCPSCGQKLQ